MVFRMKGGRLNKMLKRLILKHQNLVESTLPSLNENSSNILRYQKKMSKDYIGLIPCTNGSDKYWSLKNCISVYGQTNFYHNVSPIQSNVLRKTSQWMNTIFVVLLRSLNGLISNRLKIYSSCYLVYFLTSLTLIV